MAKVDHERFFLCCQSQKEDFPSGFKFSVSPFSLALSNGSKQKGIGFLKKVESKKRAAEEDLPLVVPKCGKYIARFQEVYEKTFLNLHLAYPVCGKELPESLFYCRTSGLYFPVKNRHIVAKHIDLDKKNETMIFSGGVFNLRKDEGALDVEVQPSVSPPFACCAKIDFTWNPVNSGIKYKSADDDNSFCGCTYQVTFRNLCKCHCQKTPAWEDYLYFLLNEESDTYNIRSYRCDKDWVAKTVGVCGIVLLFHSVKANRILPLPLWPGLCFKDLKLEWQESFCSQAKEQRLGESPRILSPGAMSERDKIQAVLWSTNLYKTGLLITKRGQDDEITFTNVKLGVCGQYQMTLLFLRENEIKVQAEILDTEQKCKCSDLPAKEKEIERGEKCCAICLDREKNHALVPCGHTFCGVCIPELLDKTCPLCKQIFTSSIKVFF